jgi:hypothetical protein
MTALQQSGVTLAEADAIAARYLPANSTLVAPAHGIPSIVLDSSKVPRVYLHSTRACPSNSLTLWACCDGGHGSFRPDVAI